jgi:5-methylcytosine-specific restriction endonuclease McrA
MRNAQKKYYEKQYKKIMENLPFEEWPIKLIKRTLFKEANHKCSECGYDYIDPKTNKGPYQIHHVDGNKKNWKKENLKILCLNCHWKTPNFAFKNRKHSKKTKERISEMATKHSHNQSFHTKYKDVL